MYEESSVILIPENCAGNDVSVVNAARVSFGREIRELTEKDQNLIDYLAREGHWSPFAHVTLSFRITAPIYIARQLAKHQIGLSWNEESRRYISSDPTFAPVPTYRNRPDNIKQGSVENEDLAQGKLSSYYQIQCKDSLNLYRDFLALGVAPEQARMVLPQCTNTSWIWTGSLYAFSRVCKQRLDNHTQKETRDVAKKIAELCREKAPYSWNALTS